MNYATMSRIPYNPQQQQQQQFYPQQPMYPQYFSNNNNEEDEDSDEDSDDNDQDSGIMPPLLGTPHPARPAHMRFPSAQIPQPSIVPVRRRANSQGAAPLGNWPMFPPQPPIIPDDYDVDDGFDRTRGPHEPTHRNVVPAKSAMKRSKKKSPPMDPRFLNMQQQQQQPPLMPMQNPYGFPPGVNYGYPPNMQPQMVQPQFMPQPPYGMPQQQQPQQQYIRVKKPKMGGWAPQPRDSDDEEEEERIVPTMSSRGSRKSRKKDPDIIPIRPGQSMQGGVPIMVQSEENPLPMPPRVMQVPTPVPPVMLAQPRAPSPPPPEPNPLPTPPKDLMADVDKVAALEAASAEVKRAHDKTERAKARILAKAEAESLQAHGVPVIDGDTDEPVAALIAGVNAPGAVPTTTRKKERKEEEVKVLGNVANSKHHHEEVPEDHHHSLTGAAKSLFKRQSIKARESVPAGPPVAPKPPKPTRPRLPSMPTDYSADMPKEEPIIPPRPRSKRASTSPWGAGPGAQQQQQPTAEIRFDPVTGQQYLVPVMPTENIKKKKKGGISEMIKRWTNGTAPAHQDEPLSVQMIMPTTPGGPTGYRSQKQKEGRRSMQQPRGTPFPGSVPLSRTMSMQDSRTGASWQYVNGKPMLVAPSTATSSRTPKQMPEPVIVFTDKRKAKYSAFRLESEHPIDWGGRTAPTACHWLESGKSENIGTGLGAVGLGTGTTYPSMQDSRGGAGDLLKGLFGKPTSAQKNARAEYVAAKTERSEFLLLLGDMSHLKAYSQQVDASGGRRQDWDAIWRQKLIEILFLKFSQHPDLLQLLISTGKAPIVYSSQDQILGDGGTVNGYSGNGMNELGQALMKIRAGFLEEDE